MSSIFSSSSLLKLGSVAAASLFGFFVFYQTMRGQGELAIDPQSEYNKQRLMLLLEDLRMEYTPYYIHYYHSLTAVYQDYGERPKLAKQLVEKIKERLEQKVQEVHTQILKKYMIESEAKLAEWIQHYMKEDPEVKRQVDIIDKNNELLFGGARPSQPNFELEFPGDLTKEKYLSMLRKIFATIRHVIYKEIRGIVRSRQDKYITKNEMKDILMNMDVQTIRGKVFEMHGLPEPSPRQPSHRILQKAHYTFMIDKDFMQTVREIKQSHERYMTAILASDVFPALESQNPLESIQDDEIPPRFGSNWFEHDRLEKENMRKADDIDIEGGEQRFGQVIMEHDDHQVDELDQLIDSQKRLLFTETKMKAVNEPSVEDQVIGEEL